LRITSWDQKDQLQRVINDVLPLISWQTRAAPRSPASVGARAVVGASAPAPPRLFDLAACSASPALRLLYRVACSSSAVPRL